MKFPTFGWGSRKLQVAPTDGYETASMTDEDSLKRSDIDSPRSLKSVEELEEKVRRAQEELTEARARVREAEQIEDLQVRKQQEEKAFAIARENQSREVLEQSQNRDAVINKFSTRLNEVQQSARLAEAKAIRDEILAKKAREEAVARAKKEAFEVERQSALEISDAPRIAAAEACFVNENGSACEQSGCRWNSLIQVCDVDCEKIKGNIKYREIECHSAIGIRRNSFAEGKNDSVIANQEYNISRICSFNDSKKRCMFRAGRFGL